MVVWEEAWAVESVGIQTSQEPIVGSFWLKKKKNEIASLVLFQDQVSKDNSYEKEENGVFSKR